VLYMLVILHYYYTVCYVKIFMPSSNFSQDYHGAGCGVYEYEYTYNTERPSQDELRSLA